MYVVSQITPLEWSKAAVCNHDDDAFNDNEFHLCKNSLNSFDGHENFMNPAEVDGAGNCSENYGTLERYLKNASELSTESDAWMNMEHRRNFLEKQRQQQESRQDNNLGSARHFEETLDLDDDGLIGFEKARHDSCSTYDNDDIELISYENNFTLKNSFWWAMGTLLQTTSDLYPKVSPINA